MTYEIKWDHLDVDEQDYLNKIGVVLETSDIRFSRELTWEEFCSTFSIMLDLDSRIADPDNHIGFAIGHCVNFGEECFDKATVKKFVSDIIELRKWREHVLGETGAALILLQAIEFHIKFCCTALKLKGMNITLDDLMSTNSSKRRQTLGQISRAFKNTQIFTSEFESHFSRFVENRNTFIHSWWSELDLRSETSSANRLPSKDAFIETHEFIQELIKDAKSIRNVFRGLHIHLRDRYIDRSEIDLHINDPLEFWTRYVPDFLAVVRRKPNK